MNRTIYAVHQKLKFANTDNPSEYARWSDRYWSGFLNYGGRDHGLGRRIAHRHALIQRISHCLTSRGTIFIEEHGQDCDGVRYDGKVGEEKITTWREFEKFREANLEWADGPMYFAILTEAQAKATEYHSIDTYAEAAGY